MKRKILLVASYFIFIFLNSNYSYSQIIGKLFNSGLKEVPTDFLNNKDVLLISSFNCKDCISYLYEKNSKITTIVLLNNLSIKEFNSIVTEYNLNIKKAYVALVSDVSRIEVKKGPVIIRSNNLVFNYEDLYTYTNGFTKTNIDINKMNIKP